MEGNPLKSFVDYSRFIAELLDRPTDIKHNRTPAPDISFTHANLPIIVQEIEDIANTLADESELQS